MHAQLSLSLSPCVAMAPEKLRKSSSEEAALVSATEYKQNFKTEPVG